MTSIVRDFLSSDALFIVFAIGALVCLFVCWKTWRSANSWHVDGDTKRLRFHGWPALLMAASGAGVFAVLTALTI